MRLADIVAAALVAIALLLVVQATWSPPQIEPGDAPERIGQRVTVTGTLLEVRWFDDAGRGQVAGGGAVLQVWFRDVHELHQGMQVRLHGLVVQEGGLPRLDVEAVDVVEWPRDQPMSLAALARNVQALQHHEVQIQGHVQGRTLHAEGHNIRLVGEAPTGHVHVAGVVAYHPPCLCHALVVGDAWTP